MTDLQIAQSAYMSAHEHYPNTLVVMDNIKHVDITKYYIYSVCKLIN